MALTSGDRIGPYEVVGLLDGGGQGEVYRARDTRLSRDVALKVLRDDRLDAHQRARFEREAQTLAALNHPNIATLHGVEAWRDVHALVMELVEGESLAARLERDGALPVDEALRIAAQIAHALEAAHERGIVHRDLKPSNVMARPDGTVKILDFGLAKTFGDDRAGTTMTMATLTGMRGVVVGTAAYMSPEQARGNGVDRRTDVWAFGCVLYEMLTGRRAFDGATASDAIAGVLSLEPDFEALPPEVNRSVRRLLRRCLQKDSRNRLRDIGDARLEIEEALGSPGTTLADPVTAPAATAHVRRSPAGRLSIAAGALAVAILAYFSWNPQTRNEGPSDPPTPIRLSTMLPAGVSVTRGPGYTSSVAVSPDGRTIVIAATEAGGQRLYRRSLDNLEPTPISGTERGSSPFFSWDGKWIGFFADGRLKRVPAAGGASVDIAGAQGYSSGASWGPDDRIVFAYNADSRLQVVPAEGGRVEPLDGEREIPGRQPEVLPDGHMVLFEIAGHVHAYDRRTGAITKLVAGTAPRYSNGYVIFSRGATLLAAPLNVEDVSVGPAIAVTERVAVELPGSGGGRHYAISRTGALVYVPAADVYELVVVGADAGERVIGQPQRSLENPRFSPDGRLVVVAARRGEEAADLWLHDLRTGTASRLTSHGGRAPVWSDEGTISYSHLGGETGIFTMGVDGGRESRLLLPLKTFHWLVGWTPDRSALLYGLMQGDHSSIIAHGNTRSRTVIEGGSVWGGRLSRDGNWLAYYVLNSGTFEVYVTPFPEGRARWLIAEGTDPSWAPDGNELYYRSGTRLMAARLDKAAGVKVLASRTVIDPFLPPLYDDYDIHPDGRTLVLVRPTNLTHAREVRAVLGWFNEFEAAGR